MQGVIDLTVNRRGKNGKETFMQYIYIYNDNNYIDDTYIVH